MNVLAIAGLGAPELLIILAVVLLLFGGSRLAGLGKSTGRALKEFKEETKGLKGEQKGDPEITGTTGTTGTTGSFDTQPGTGVNGAPYGDPEQVQHPVSRPANGSADSDVRRDV
jgi:sec-independent protein translocase protein TatA